MARRQQLMSDALKWELAKELGVDNIVSSEGWGGVPSRDCGNLVKMAIERAERSLVGSDTGPRIYR
ncbi:MAG: small, acid-soluble spore protein, alpha/beta type [Bacillota bacterium]